MKKFIIRMSAKDKEWLALIDPLETPLFVDIRKDALQYSHSKAMEVLKKVHRDYAKAIVEVY